MYIWTCTRTDYVCKSNKLTYECYMTPRDFYIICLDKRNVEEKITFKMYYNLFYDITIVSSFAFDATQQV